MRVLLAPLSMPLPTMGPAGRTISLAAEGVRRRHDIAVCAARDGNLEPEALPREAAWLPAPLPAFMGLPRLAGRLLPPLMMLTGMSRRARVASFEQVLFMGGHLHLGFFLRAVEALPRAMRSLQPEVVFSEYCYEAIVAARLEGLPVCGTHSFPGRADFASSPRLSREIRRRLQAQGFGASESVLSLFEEQTPGFVASSPSLEPFSDEVVHVGPLTSQHATPSPQGRPARSRPRDAMVVYMGNGAVPVRQLVAVLSAAAGPSRQIYIAAAGRKRQPRPNVHIAPRFDFAELLPRAEVFVNHGGQNSIMDGLLAGAPQIMIPGRVFERNYNAGSVERLGAGRKLRPEEFTSAKFSQAMEELAASDAAAKARRAGAELASLGGAAKVFEVLESRLGGCGRWAPGHLRGSAPGEACVSTNPRAPLSPEGPPAPGHERQSLEHA